MNSLRCEKVQCDRLATSEFVQNEPEWKLCVTPQVFVNSTQFGHYKRAEGRCHNKYDNLSHVVKQPVHDGTTLRVHPTKPSIVVCSEDLCS